jgi:hypothetical protein
MFTGRAPLTRHRQHSLRFLIVAAATGASLGACHSNDASDGGVGADVDFVTCRTEARAKDYDLLKQGGTPLTSTPGGLYVLKLLSNTFTDSSNVTTDQPPAKGIDVWTVEIDRADTLAGVDGLTVSVSPYMPDHRHGTTPVGVTPVGAGGDYTIAPLNLYMAGYWEITVSLVDPTADAGAGESVMVPICVPD